MRCACASHALPVGVIGEGRGRPRLSSATALSFAGPVSYGFMSVDCALAWCHSAPGTARPQPSVRSRDSGPSRRHVARGVADRPSGSTGLYLRLYAFQFSYVSARTVAYPCECDVWHRHDYPPAEETVALYPPR